MLPPAHRILRPVVHNVRVNNSEPKMKRGFLYLIVAAIFFFVIYTKMIRTHQAVTVPLVEDIKRIE